MHAHRIPQEEACPIPESVLGDLYRSPRKVFRLWLRIFHRLSWRCWQCIATPLSLAFHGTGHRIQLR